MGISRGGVEFGETLANALVREVREEFGFVIEVVQLLEVVDHILPGKSSTGSPLRTCADTRTANRVSWSRTNARRSAGSVLTRYR